MEKFTEKNTEKFFYIFFCKFFCIFFRIFFYIFRWTELKSLKVNLLPMPSAFSFFRFASQIILTIEIIFRNTKSFFSSSKYILTYQKIFGLFKCFDNLKLFSQPKEQISMVKNEIHQPKKISPAKKNFTSQKKFELLKNSLQQCQMLLGFFLYFHM